MINKSYKILMVDDDLENIKLLGNILRDENYMLGFASDGNKALKLLKEANDYDLVLLDVNMPNLNGYEVCRMMKEHPILKDIPVIFLSSYSEVDFIVEGFESGANDYVTKPIKKKELLARINTQLKLKEVENSLIDSIIEKEKLLVSEQQLLDKTLKGSIKILIDILSMIGPVALFPTKKTSQNAKKLASDLNITKVWELEIALLLSKLGCITIPSEVLQNKLEGKNISAEQNKIFLQHPQLGKKLLSNIPRFEYIAESIAYQFKHYDGSGYPDDDIQGERIPLFGRILVILNDIEELNHSGNTREENLRQLQSRENWYDPQLLRLVNIEMFEEISIEFKKESESKKEASNKKESANVLTLKRQPPKNYSSVINVSSIQNGYLLAENIVNKNGMIIVRRDKEITDVIKHSLIHLSQIGSISEFVKVYKKPI